MKEKENLKYLKKSKLKNQKVWDKILLRQSDNQSEKWVNQKEKGEWEKMIAIQKIKNKHLIKTSQEMLMSLCKKWKNIQTCNNRSYFMKWIMVCFKIKYI